MNNDKLNNQFKKDLGIKILIYRQQFKYSQRELGIKLGQIDPELTVGQATVSSWEKGRTEPSMKHMKALAKIFGCTVSDLLSYSEETTIAGFTVDLTFDEYKIYQILREDPKKVDAIKALLGIETDDYPVE